MSTADLLRSSISYGLVMSILLGVVITLSQVLNAEIWLDDYPPDIKEKFGPLSQRAKR